MRTLSHALLVASVLLFVGSVFLPIAQFQGITHDGRFMLTIGWMGPLLFHAGCSATRCS